MSLQRYEKSKLKHYRKKKTKMDIVKGRYYIDKESKDRGAKKTVKNRDEVILHEP